MGRPLGIAIVLTAVLSPLAAAADDNDIVLSRLTRALPDGTFVPQNAELRSLASELGVVLAPRLLTPADSLGWGGFQLSVDYATTTIDPNGRYWRAREASPDPGGESDVPHGPAALQTTGFFARKGMWFPIPMEAGVGAVHLVDSKIWTAQLYVKIAVHEGYHQLFLPSLSVRGGVARMMTQRELDLTIASIDVMASKHFGVGGTWRFVPFLGANVLLVIPRSEVIDPTPQIDPLVMGNEGDALKNFVFKDQDTVVRKRFVAGVKAQYYIFQITAEATFALAGDTVDDRAGTADVCVPDSDTQNCDAKDGAAAQRTLSLSVGVDF